MEQERYLKLIKATSPKTPMVRTLATSFVVGGFICCVGQAVSDILRAVYAEMPDTELRMWTTVIMIFLGALFTGLGLYDRLGYYAGGGSIIPITGFANSIVSPAMEYNREGVFFGICSKMFTIAGPIIVFGVVASVIVGLFALIFV